MYLQGGAILPVGLPIKHVGEASLEDDLSLIVSLDENGMHYTSCMSVPFNFCLDDLCLWFVAHQRLVMLKGKSKLGMFPLSLT